MGSIGGHKGTQRVLIALAVLALFSTGCSNTAVRSSSGTGTDTDPAKSRAQAVTFAHFMRENGVDSFPDPDASGEFRYALARGSSLNPRTLVWKQAINACKAAWTPFGVAIMVAVDGGVVVLQPPGALGSGVPSAPELEQPPDR